jgi:hypothetical protein
MGTIINLGCRRQYRSYRRSRAGQRIFHRISVVLSERKGTPCIEFPSKPRLANLHNVVSETPVHKATTQNSCVFFNSRSVCNKLPLIHEFFDTHQPDVCGITETWLTADKEYECSNLPPLGYKAVFHHRSGKPGGGLALLTKCDTQVANLDFHKDFKSMECISGQLTLNVGPVNLHLIYRKDKVAFLVFIDEMVTLLEQSMTYNAPLLFAGDFNIKFSCEQDQNFITFRDFLESFGLQNHIHTPTHESGNTLDLIITETTNDNVKNCEALEYISDHCSTHITLINTVVSSNSQHKYRNVRSLKKIDAEKFASDIKKAMTALSIHTDAETATVDFHIKIGNVLDVHAPLKEKKITIKSSPPWLNDDLIALIRDRRTSERRFRSSPTADNLLVFKQKRNTTTKAIKLAYKCHTVESLQNNKNNSKELYKICNGLLGRDIKLPLPPYSSGAEMADQFNDFFISKIEKIRIIIDNTVHTQEEIDRLPSEVTTKHQMCRFATVTKDEMRTIIMSSPSKSCELDAVPTSLLKEHVESFLPGLTHIANLSLTNGVFPMRMKEALVRPLLKKVNLALDLKNFRPVSNLSFISKLIEKCVSKQVLSHINEHKLSEVMQSAYRSNHSTETAILKVRSDILENFAKRKTTILVLLDLSAAFDTIDHDVLLNRLSSRFGLKGTVLNWFQSYLTERIQCVVVESSRSSKLKLHQGVPQGSVLGPVCFTLYTTPLGDICRAHGLPFKLYAGDTQLYLPFDAGDDEDFVITWDKINGCVNDIALWMCRNKLKLNGDKTEVLFLGTAQQLLKCAHLTQGPQTVGTAEIAPVTSVRNLGFIFDNKLKNTAHISKVVSTCFYMLKLIRSVRHLMDMNSVRLVVGAFVTSRIDYCNSSLIGSSKVQLKRLQAVQNMSARVILQLSKYDHISIPLFQLHWLKISERIAFKICTMVHQCIYGKAPDYLKDLLPVVKTTHDRRLRSASNISLDVASCVNAQTRACSFTYAGPTAWNALPQHLRCEQNFDIFKGLLKTHFFRISHETVLYNNPSLDVVPREQKTKTLDRA